MEGDWIGQYCRDATWGRVVHVAQRCGGGGSGGGGEAKWRYYQGLGLVLGGKFVEGITCLEPLIHHADYGLAAAHLSLIAHQSCKSVDHEAVSQLEWRVEEARAAGTADLALQVAAAALAYAGRHQQARRYLDRLLHTAPGLALSGWLELQTGDKRAAASAFKSALAQDKSDLNAILGEVAVSGEAEALARLNQLVVRYPKCAAPLVEKMRLQLRTRDWAQALDTAARVLALDTDSLAALELRALHHIVVAGDYKEGAVAVRRLGAQLEAQSGDLVAAAQLFSRVSGRHPTLLTETLRLAERAVQVGAGGETRALLEVGAQHNLAGRHHEAGQAYRAVTRTDAASTEALTGLTATQLATSGLTDQVVQQVEFLAEVMGAEPSAQLLVLRAQTERDWALLDRAAERLRASAAPFSYGPRFLTHINPHLMMTIADLYPYDAEGLSRKVAVLREVVGLCPGLVAAVLALAKALMAAGDLTSATKEARNLLSQLDATNTEAHLVLAQIHLAQEEYEEANASLELGLSFNLQVREWPLYHVILGAIQRNHGDTDACIQSMYHALSLNKGEHKLSVSEVGSLYMELVGCLTASGRADDASQALREAGEALRGTEQEGRLMVARGELAAIRGEYSAALSLLDNIPSDHPYYLQARKKMAEIHLHKLNDARAFAECYKQLVASKPSVENLILLGDAYMAIQEPELAVEAYEKAMKSSSSDAKLSARLGRILIKTHHYGKAIKCFRDAGSEGSLELAQLLMRLGQLQAAESALAALPSAQKALMQAKVLEKSGNIPEAMKVVKEAREALGASEVGTNAKMCTQLAEYASALRDHDSAISYYKRALQYSPDTHTEIALAKLYMQVNDWNACQSVCSALLAQDPDNEPALLMLADLAFRRVDLADASAHFSALLTRRPSYWVALARLVEVKRRLAQLEEVKPFLEAAAAMSPGAPGLAYCTGLYEWYAGNTQAALQQFNTVRGDAEWGQQALHNMVELCLAGSGSGGEGAEMAGRLLSQMTPLSPDEQAGVRLLRARVQLASADKQQVEQAMQELATLAMQDTLRISATLGLAQGYVQQKQQARARNVLKRVATQASWLVEEAEPLERSWLLLAELHTQSGKHESAEELLRRVLAHNASSHRAHELIALIAEKDQKYLEAGLRYQQAWRLSGENDPALGFKLAFNQMKAKRYADAITTCRTVLRINPDYPRIRKEILDKAISHLRT